ncbi:hypothetical protein PtB15_1B448 [Puccinia triticina]|nr:hypothetical protein PtB15_1B448 [Puccinia triticina]
MNDHPAEDATRLRQLLRKLLQALPLASEHLHAFYGPIRIPTIVHVCAQRLLCSQGLATQGIFRINGNLKRINQLERLFADPALLYGKLFNIALPYFSLHDVAGVLRRYLWALPVEPLCHAHPATLLELTTLLKKEPLVPHQATMEMVIIYRRYTSQQGPSTGAKAGRSSTIAGAGVVEELEGVLRRQMDRRARDLLHYLLELLARFSLHAPDNLMTPKNLAIDYLARIDRVQEVLRILIDHFALLSTLFIPPPPHHLSASPSPSPSSSSTTSSPRLPTIHDDYRLLLLHPDHASPSTPPHLRPQFQVTPISLIAI